MYLNTNIPLQDLAKTNDASTGAAMVGQNNTFNLMNHSYVSDNEDALQFVSYQNYNQNTWGASYDYGYLHNGVKLPFITKESCPEFYFAKGGTSTGTTWYRQFPNTATTCSDSMTKVLVINDLQPEETLLMRYTDDGEFTVWKTKNSITTKTYLAPIPASPYCLIDVQAAGGQGGASSYELGSTGVGIFRETTYKLYAGGGGGSGGFASFSINFNKLSGTLHRLAIDHTYSRNYSVYNPDLTFSNNNNTLTSILISSGANGSTSGGGAGGSVKIQTIDSSMSASTTDAVAQTLLYNGLCIIDTKNGLDGGAGYSVPNATVWNDRKREAGSNGNAFGPTNLLSINTQSAPCSLFNSTSTAVGGFSGANYNNLYFYAGGGGGASSLMAHGGSTHLATGGDFDPWKASQPGYGAGSAGADMAILNKTTYFPVTTESLQSGGSGAIWIYYIPHSHAINTWNITKNPTCHEYGSKEGICLKCGKKITQDIETTSHTYVLDKDASTPNPETCNRSEPQGCDVYKCINEGCTATYSVPIPYYEHNYDWYGPEDMSYVWEQCTECGEKRTGELKILVLCYINGNQDKNQTQQIDPGTSFTLSYEWYMHNKPSSIEVQTAANNIEFVNDSKDDYIYTITLRHLDGTTGPIQINFVVTE